MKKLHCLGAVATFLIAASALGGCSSTSDSPMTSGGSGNIAGTGVTAGTGTGGASGGAGGSGGGGGARPPGVKIAPPNSYVYFTGADAAPGGAAPAAWGGPSACSTCHGANGEGVNGLAPEVRHMTSTYGSWIITHGRAGTGMSPFPDLPAADVTSIITWLGSLPRPTTPAGLYKDFCGNCHGPMTPTGGNVAVNIQGVTMADLKMYVRMGAGTDPAMRDEYMPAFSMTDLTDAELAQIAQFIMATP